MRKLLCLLALLGSALPAWSDEVKLVSGGRLVGIARVEGGKVLVETSHGTIGIPRSLVAEILPGWTPIHEVADRAARLGPEAGAEDLFELAVWARENGVHRRAQELLERVIALEPGHEGARRLLGYRLHEGRWMTETEVNRANGLVEFRGQWITPKEQAAILAREQAALLSREKAALERRARPRTEEPVGRLGMPAYPPARGSSSRGGAEYFVGYYGWFGGFRHGIWGYHWAGSHVGSYVRIGGAHPATGTIPSR